MSFRLSEEEAWARVAEAHTGILTTLRRDGRPVTLPVWHAVVERAIYVRTPSGAKKVSRVKADGRGSFLVESGKKWGELTAVSVPVVATVVTFGAVVATAKEAIDVKYADYVMPSDKVPDAVQAAYADMVVIRLEPDGRILTWDNSALLQR